MAKKSYSAYSAAHAALIEFYDSDPNKIYLTNKEVRSVLQSTPECVFTPGTTIDDVLSELESWGVLKQIVPRRKKEKYIILVDLK